jgi:hypothetical protein
LEIAWNAEDAQVVVGDFEPEKRTIERLKEQSAQAGKDAENADRLLNVEQRRMYKQIHQTRFSLDFSMGKIFKTIVRSLHDLFQATRESDRIAEQIRVHGKNLQTHLASLKEHEEDATAMTQTAKLSLVAEDDGEVRAVVTDMLGDESALDSEGFEGFALRFADEQVTLESLGA